VGLPGAKPPSASTEGHLCLAEERAAKSTILVTGLQTAHSRLDGLASHRRLRPRGADAVWFTILEPS
jgi:hypothetical protein